MFNCCKKRKDEDYFMYKEIMSQKDVFKALNAKYFDENLNINKADFPLGKYDRIIICASGSSNHAADIAKFFIEDITKIPCSIEYSSEFAHKNTIIRENDLFIAISQSGNTADTFESLMKAKRMGAKTFGITNDATSKIHANADFKVLADAGEEKSIAATKSFTAQLVILYVFALALAENNNNENLYDLKKEYLSIGDNYDEIYAQRDNIKKIAKYIKNIKTIAILGRNINAALSREASLKTKETCYISAVFAPAGEFMHGHFAILDKTIPIIGIANKTTDDEENYKLVIHNLQEITTKRNADLILVKAKGDDVAQKDLKHKFAIEVPVMSKYFAPFLSLVALQMLAFETACLRNDNVDEPRDLCKCVANE